MICIWLFENLVPLCITDSYYPNFFDNLLDTQFMDMDIDNYVVVTKSLKTPTRRLLRNEITGQHWYPPDTALKATQPKRERERERSWSFRVPTLFVGPWEMLVQSREKLRHENRRGKLQAGFMAEPSFILTHFSPLAQYEQACSIRH